MNFTENERTLLIALGTDNARNPAEQLYKSEWVALVAAVETERAEPSEGVEERFEELVGYHHSGLAKAVAWALREVGLDQREEVSSK